MVNFIDISGHQVRDGLTDLSPLLPQVDAVVCKATEGLTIVDSACDMYVQQLKRAGVPYGFYHFARNNDPELEAAYFIGNTENYFNDGIPILDWEAHKNVEWVNSFVRYVHSRTGIWPWIYANPWRFNLGGVEANCMRWVAAYPNYTHPTFDMAKDWDVPDADGFVGAWQFCSDGRLDGHSGNLDCDLFYGDKEGWLKYAGADASSGSDGGSGSGNNGSLPSSTLENDEYKVTIERKQ